MMKNGHSKLCRLLVLLLSITMLFVLMGVQVLAADTTTEQTQTEYEPAAVVDFGAAAAQDAFDFYSATDGGFALQDGMLTPTGTSGEFKAIYKGNGKAVSSVSVELHPVGTDGPIYGGLYINASNAANEQDKITALYVGIESNFSGWTDAANRIDIIEGVFDQAWSGFVGERFISETGNGNNLFSGGKKEPITLRVDIDGNVLTITVSLVSDTSRFVTTTYTAAEGTDFSLGQVGIRSHFNNCRYDNFAVNTPADAGEGVASVSGFSFTTVAEALEAANGSVVKLLASSDEAITISGNTVIDLAGNTLSNVTVAEGGSLKLADTVSGGSAAVTGSVEHLTEVDGKNYLVVEENGVYSAHIYGVEITHISLNPAKDALGYKAALIGDEVVQQYVTGIGFNLWLDGGAVKTYTASGKQQVTLRLQNILTNKGGEMNINATAFITMATDETTLTETSSQQTTSMKQTLEIINGSWNRYNKVQKTAVQDYVKKYSDAVASWSIENIISWTEEDNVLKILTIGNSFSIDSMEYFYQIAKDLGVEKIKLGNLYIGGCSLATHYANIQSGNAAYTYYTNDSGVWKNTANYTMQAAIESENWDYISFQQASPSSGDASTYDTLVDLIEEVKVYCPDAQFLWHMTWAYQSDSTHSAFPNYNSDQNTMYQAIVNAVQTKIVPNEDIVKIIPAGTAIQNARTSYLGDHLTRDGYHLTYDIGRYIAGITWVETLTGLDASKLTYRPEGVTEDVMALCIESAKNAIATPYAVTNSQYTLENCYLELELNLTSGWYSSTNTSGDPYKLYASTSTLPFYATKVFSKAELPIGTIIANNAGYNYRPEGWINGAGVARPAAITTKYVMVTDEWWGDWTERGFNIKVSSLDVTADEAAAGFKIYVPLSAYEKVDLTVEKAFYNAYLYPANKTQAASTSLKFFTVQTFTEETLPVGSIILNTEGRNIRLERWIDGTVKNSDGSRGPNSTAKQHVVDASWWDGFDTRAFNIPVTSLDDSQIDALLSAFIIYVPKTDSEDTQNQEYNIVTGDLLTSDISGFEVQDGRLVPPGGGESKVILTETPTGDKTISVDIYPGSSNLINSGIYLGASDAAAAQDSINAVTVMVESNVADNLNRADIVIGNFPAWQEYHRVVSEGDAALFTDGIKAPVNLTVTISGNDLTATLSLISAPSKQLTTTYTYTGSYDLAAGQVGLRSQYSDCAFDNFEVTSAQETAEYTFDSDAAVEGLAFYHSTWADDVKITAAKTLALHKTNTVENGTYTAAVNTYGDNAAGIVFGADETGKNYYLYRLTADRFVELVKVQNGVETVLDKGYLSAGHINTNFNRIEVVKDGSSIYCYYYNRFDKINCYAVYEDAAPLTGTGVGLWAATSGTVFQNVSVSTDVNIRKADVLIFGHSYTEMWWDYETYFPEYSSIDDIGIGGSVAAHWESLADEVVAYEPKLGIYNIGINDLTGGTTPKAVVDSMESALLTIKEALPEFEVVLVSVSHCPARSTITDSISQTNALMRNLAASYDWINYAEAEYLFCTNSSDPLSTDASLFIDGLHPSADGYQLMADVIRSAINGENQPEFDENLAESVLAEAKANKLASMGIYSEHAYTAENWTQAQSHYDAAVTKINACGTQAQLDSLDLSEEIAALDAIPNKSVNVISNILNAETRDALKADSWTKTNDNTVNVNDFSYALDNTTAYSDMEVVFSVSNNTGTVGTGGVFLRATALENNGIEGYLINYVSDKNYMQVYYVNNVYNTDGSSYVLTYLGGVVYGAYGNVVGTEFHVKIEGDKLYLSTLEKYLAGEEPLTVVDLTKGGAYRVFESGYCGVLSWNNDVYFDLQLKNFAGEPYTAPEKKSDAISGKKIAWLGSSVTYGSASGEYSMADVIAEERTDTVCYKYAVSGTTLVNESDNSYVARLQQIDTSLELDMLVVQLSTNDATQGKALGQISDGVDMDSFDTTTVAGAIEYIIAYAKNTWDCPVVFYTGTYYESEAYASMVELLLDIQAKWDIGVIDLWNNAEMTALYGTAQYSLYMSDAIHPTALGYKEWWAPVFEEYMINFWSE